MNNNDELALKLKQKAMRPDDAGGVMVGAISLLSLLAERDADKKQLAAMSQAFLNLKLLADVYLHAYEEAKASVAELEARTVSVKLASIHKNWGERYLLASDVEKALTAAGIKLDVGE